MNIAVAELTQKFVDRIKVEPELEAVREDVLWLLENEKLSIKTKSRELLPLRLNPIQRRILDKIRELQKQNKPIRLWILKARQEGVSTLIEALIYCLTSQLENVNSLILADDLDGTNYLFGMSKLYHEQLDDKFKHELLRSNEKKIEFAGRHSQILVDTSDNLDAGRKYTFQYVHLSEVAYFRDGKSLMDGLNQSVPELPETMIVGETTANGVGGYFYEQWKKAKKGETDWIPIFLAWFDNPEYSSPIPENFVLTEEEIKLKNKYPLTNQQIMWRRNCIKNKCDGSIDTFNQEYPATDTEAFLVSGRCRFNSNCLKNIEVTSIRPPQAIGNLVEANGSISFQPDPNGILKVWKYPVEIKERLVIGSDVAEGLEVEGAEQDKKDDYSTAEVLGAVSLRQYAEIQCRYAEDVFSEELFRLGVWYGKPVLGVERNNSGIAVLHLLNKKKYPKLFYMEQFAKATQTRKVILGWRTTLGTKPLMISEVDRVIRNALGEIVSEELLAELMTYVKLADGSTSAQQGCHDDLVMAYAIALQMCSFIPIKKDEEKNLPTQSIDNTEVI